MGKLALAGVTVSVDVLSYRLVAELLHQRSGAAALPHPDVVACGTSAP